MQKSSHDDNIGARERSMGATILGGVSKLWGDNGLGF
jgi:hypothetical protein